MHLESRERALVTGPVRGSETARVVAGGASDVPRLEQVQQRLAVSERALRVRTVKGQPGEELRSHAAAAARVEIRAGHACAAGLGPAKVLEELRLPPDLLKAARVADIPGEKGVVDRERARVDVAHRVDQAHHATGPAQVQARQRVAVSGQV